MRRLSEGEKNYLLNRRETERNPAIIDVSHREISK